MRYKGFSVFYFVDYRTETYINSNGDQVIIGDKEYGVTGDAKPLFKENVIERNDKVAFEVTQDGNIYAVTAIDGRDITVNSDKVDISGITFGKNLTIKKVKDDKANDVTVKGNLEVDSTNFKGTKFDVTGTTTILSGTVEFNSTLKGDVTVKSGTVTFNNVKFGSSLKLENNAIVTLGKGVDIKAEDIQLGDNVTLSAAAEAGQEVEDLIDEAKENKRQAGMSIDEVRFGKSSLGWAVDIYVDESKNDPTVTINDTESILVELLNEKDDVIAKRTANIDKVKEADGETRATTTTFGHNDEYWSDVDVDELVFEAENNKTVNDIPEGYKVRVIVEFIGGKTDTFTFPTEDN